MIKQGMVTGVGTYRQQLESRCAGGKGEEEERGNKDEDCEHQ